MSWRKKHKPYFLCSEAKWDRKSSATSASAPKSKIWVNKQRYLLLEYARKQHLFIDELSTTGSHGKLLLAIYSYFAEAERNFISMRIKQGLAAAKAKGVKLGRPKGSRNKKRVLDPYRDEILKYLQKGIDLASVRKLINPELEHPIFYNSYKYFVRQDSELLAVWQAQGA